MRRSIICTLAAIFLIFSPTCGFSGQDSTGGHEQHALTYDVVSLKRNVSGNPSGVLSMEPTSNKMTAVNVPLEKLVQFAYNFRRNNLVIGGPGWARVERYDLTAKVADQDVAQYQKLSDDARRKMLQAVLEDRCQMKAHIEQREVSAYALTIAKSGPKFDTSSSKQAHAAVLGPDGRPSQEENLITSRGKIKGVQILMSSLALSLTAVGDGRQVVDKSGLTGRYDITLNWSPDNLNPEGVDPTAAVNSQAMDLPSLFAAVQEQLGLKLEPTKIMADTLVLDRFERPIDN